MIELTALTAARYLQSGGHIHASERVDVCELSGGVSNRVLLVRLPERGQEFILKQACSRLRVAQEWLCSVKRIWREVEVLRICGQLLAAEELGAAAARERLGVPVEIGIHVPQILFEDRENYCYAMSAAPDGCQTWKELLLAGRIDPAIAAACSRLLATLHGRSWNNRAIAAQLDDREFFVDLRLDPYYRQIARVHPDLSSPIQQLIDSVWNCRLSLTHGDFSPKNLLIWPDNLMLIDFEVGHFGDPAFDNGFYLTHLALKSLHLPLQRGKLASCIVQFWQRYQQTLAPWISAEEMSALESRTCLNLAGCMLARIDGKSPVDYLNAESTSAVRQLARGWLQSPPQALAEIVDQLAKQGRKRSATRPRE